MRRWFYRTPGQGARCVRVRVGCGCGWGVRCVRVRVGCDRGRDVRCVGTRRGPLSARRPGVLVSDARCLRRLGLRPLQHAHRHRFHDPTSVQRRTRGCWITASIKLLIGVSINVNDNDAVSWMTRHSLQSPSRGVSLLRVGRRRGTLPIAALDEFNFARTRPSPGLTLPQCSRRRAMR